MSETITARGFQQSEGTADWRVLATGAAAWFPTASHAEGARLVAAVLALPGTPPDLDLRPGGVRVLLPAAPELGSLTVADAERAAAISRVAREAGLMADPSGLYQVQLTIDALDGEAVRPFWERALGYRAVGDEDLVDPARRDPSIWFQEQDEPRPLRNRIHLDIGRTGLDDAARAALHEVAGPDDAGPYGLRLADAEGNEADLVPEADAWADRPELADWALLFAAVVHYPTTSEQAAALVTEVAALADAAGVPLQVDVRPEGVTIDTSKDRWEVDPGVAQVAARVQAAARGLGLTPATAGARFVQVMLDVQDLAGVSGFWRALLGYVEDPRASLGVTDVHDPHRLGPTLLFQDLDPADTGRHAQRNRIHLDLFVPDDQVQARIATALAAGGRVVSDAASPLWTVVADPEGNEVCVATSPGREEAWAEQTTPDA